MAIALKENRPVRGCEAVAERPDGTRVPFIPYPTPLHDSDGRLIGAINMLVDITERKRSEQALRQREHLLLEAQRIARMGHWRLDIATGALEWSAGTHLLMGTSPEEHTPSLRDLVSRIHPEDRGSYIRASIGCLESGKTSQWEFRVSNSDGKEWVAQVEGHCETDETGKVTALFGIYQDVTEQRRMQARLREARDAAQAADRAKSTFLACMSHELRTPLNAIIGFSDLLQTEIFGPLGSDQYLEYAVDIYRSGHHLLELVNDLLDMARIEAGMVDLQEEAIDIATLIREAVQLVSGSVPEVTHDFDVPASAPVLMADRRRMKQVLINLIGNAVKFTPDRGRIKVVVSEDDQHMFIAITDTGIGIPPEKIGELCQPFNQI
jgi:signal transduction histidine kinase